MATKLPFGEIKSSLLASNREASRPGGLTNASQQLPVTLLEPREGVPYKRGTHILCPLQFLLVGGYSIHCLFSPDCLPSRRLLRAVKCLLPVYCVSNCSLGGENISQFTQGNENRIKSSEGCGRSSIKPRESDHASMRSPKCPCIILSFQSW